MCDRWIHISCAGLDAKDFDYLRRAKANDKHIHWFCIGCDGSTFQVMKTVTELNEKYSKLGQEIETVKVETAREVNRDLNRLPDNRLRNPWPISVNGNRHSKVKLRFAIPSSRPRYKGGQETDNDQKRTPQSLQLAFVNKTTSSHCPTVAEHGRSFRPTPPTSHPLSDTGPCRPACLMSATAPAAAVKWSCQRKCLRRRCRRRPLIAAATYNTMCLRINDATPGFRHHFIITTS